MPTKRKKSTRTKANTSKKPKPSLTSAPSITLTPKDTESTQIVNTDPVPSAPFATGESAAATAAVAATDESAAATAAVAGTDESASAAAVAGTYESAGATKSSKDEKGVEPMSIRINDQPFMVMKKKTNSELYDNTSSSEELPLTQPLDQDHTPKSTLAVASLLLPASVPVLSSALAPASVPVFAAASAFQPIIKSVATELDPNSESDDVPSDPLQREAELVMEEKEAIISAVIAAATAAEAAAPQ